MAVDDLSKDSASVVGEVAALGSGVRQLRPGISAIGGGTMGAVGPLLPVVIDLLK